MQIAIEYTCREWDYNAVQTAMRMSANNVPDQINSIVLICDKDKVLLPSMNTMIKHLKKASGTLEKITVIKAEEVDALPEETRIGCYVEITPYAYSITKARTIKARRYLTLVHKEELEEFDWSS